MLTQACWTPWPHRTLRAGGARRAIRTAEPALSIGAAALYRMVAFTGIIIELWITLLIIEAVVSVQ